MTDWDSYHRRKRKTSGYIVMEDMDKVVASVMVPPKDGSHMFHPGQPVVP